MIRLTTILMLGNFFLTIGCVGPKFMSSASGNHQTLAPIPKKQKAVIMPFEGSGASELIDKQKAGAHFAGVLAEKLKRSGLFSEVGVGISSGASGEIVISGEILRIGKKSWGSRALVMNSEMSFGVTGAVHDHQHNLLMTFTKSRSAQGGLMGAGGWMSAGAGAMIKQLADWVAADVLNAIKKGNRSS